MNRDLEYLVSILEKAGEKLSNRNMVLQLCNRNVSDYDRGVIQGKIEMLSHIMSDLASKDEDER